MKIKHTSTHIPRASEIEKIEKKKKKKQGDESD